MRDVCMLEILELPLGSLKKVLPKAPARTLARLLAAYPRALTRPFMDVLSECLSQPTIEFLREEVNATRIPSFSQIREAERELARIIESEEIVPPSPAGGFPDKLAA